MCAWICARDERPAVRQRSISARRSSSTSRTTPWEDVGGVDLVFDLIGGDVAKRSTGLIRAGGTLVTITGPPEARPANGLAIDFVVVCDRAQLSEIVRRVRDGRLRTNIGTVATLDDAVAAFNPTERIKGKTIIRVRLDTCGVSVGTGVVTRGKDLFDFLNSRGARKNCFIRLQSAHVLDDPRTP
jgi:D-arabinose 1-dehydrogenase-like Zn-dependent alcohol dehydrogenase